MPVAVLLQEVRICNHPHKDLNLEPLHRFVASLSPEECVVCRISPSAYRRGSTYPRSSIDLRNLASSVRPHTRTVLYQLILSDEIFNPRPRVTTSQGRTARGPSHSR